MFQPLNRSYALGFHPYSVEYMGAFKLTSNDIKRTMKDMRMLVEKPSVSRFTLNLQ